MTYVPNREWTVPLTAVISGRASGSRSSRHGRPTGMVDQIEAWEHRQAVADGASSTKQVCEAMLVHAMPRPARRMVAAPAVSGRFGRLDAKRPALLEVALHPGVPEVGVEGDFVAVAQQPGPVAADRVGAHPPTEHDLHLFRPA
jgi:hypothetical protein